MTDDSKFTDQAFEPLAAAVKDNPRGLLLLAAQAHQRGANDRAYQLARQAAAIAPDDAEIGARVADIVAICVPGWHISLVKDGPRNDAFQHALERAVTADARILDIGAGSGLLAMMAARSGAGDVHSCELNPAMAAVAKEIIEANGFADTITLHDKNSAKLDAEADMGGKADIIVAEILGSDVVCEFVLPTMRDAVRRLAKPGARLIPCAADIRVALAWWPTAENRRIADVSGFDLSLLNRMRRSYFMVPTDSPRLEIRGDEATLYAFDFASTDAVPERADMELVSAGGQVNGVIQWVHIQMDSEGSYTNRPGPETDSSWACQFFPFAEPIDTEPGDRIKIGATIASNRLRLWKG